MKTKMKKDNRKIYLCKEGRETFKMKAKNRSEAEEFAQMYNAIVIKEVK